MTGYLLVAAGAAIGAPLRYLVDRIVQSRQRGAFPWGTLTVNVVGSAVFGALTAALLAGVSSRLDLLVAPASAVRSPPTRRSATKRSGCGSGLHAGPRSPTQRGASQRDCWPRVSDSSSCGRSADLSARRSNNRQA